MTFYLIILGLAMGSNISLMALFIKRESAHAEERRFLINHITAKTPTEFAVLAAASRPDETVETVAEARVPRPSTPSPLGL